MEILQNYQLLPIRVRSQFPVIDNVRMRRYGHNLWSEGLLVNELVLTRHTSVLLNIPTFPPAFLFCTDFNRPLLKSFFLLSVCELALHLI